MRRISHEQLQNDLGRRSAELRAARGLTQAALAEVLEVSTNYVARIEGGWENLTLESLVKIANALEVQVSDLFVPPTIRKARPGRPPKVNREPAGSRRSGGRK